MNNTCKLLTVMATLAAFGAEGMRPPDDPIKLLKDEKTNSHRRVQAAMEVLENRTGVDPETLLRAAQVLVNDIGLLTQDELNDLPMMAGRPDLAPVRPLLLQAAFRAITDPAARLFAARNLVDLPGVDPAMLQEATRLVAEDDPAMVQGRIALVALNDPNADPRTRVRVAREVLENQTGTMDPETLLRAAQVLVNDIGLLTQDELNGLPMMAGRPDLNHVRLLLLQAVFRAPNADHQTQLLAARELVGLPGVDPAMLQEATRLVEDPHAQARNDLLQQLDDPNADPRTRVRVAREVLGNRTDVDPETLLRAAQVLVNDIGLLAQDELNDLPMMAGRPDLAPVRLLLLQAVFRAITDPAARLFAARELVGLPDGVDPAMLQEAQALLNNQ